MSSSVERVEVLEPVQRRRRYSVDEKLPVLEEAALPGMTIAFVARRRGISPGLLFHRRRRMAEGGKDAVRADDAVVSAAEVRALEKRIRELERVLGRKTPKTNRQIGPGNLGASDRDNCAMEIRWSAAQLRE